jgi:hypothetical protein
MYIEIQLLNSSYMFRRPLPSLESISTSRFKTKLNVIKLDNINECRYFICIIFYYVLNILMFIFPDNGGWYPKHVGEIK